MARTVAQNRIARERTRRNITLAAIEVFAERGVDGARISDITRRAGVAQGLVSYHFGGKEQLISAVIDAWFDALFAIARVDGPADERLAGVIDGGIMSVGYALPLQRVVMAIQQQPATHRLYAEAEDRHHAIAVRSEEAVRDIFRERGAEDPELEEIMLRGTVEGVLLKYSVYGDAFPLEDARRWVYRIYGLGEPVAPLALELPPREHPVQLRASRAVRG